MYALTVDKDGPKLKPHDAQSAGDPWIEPTVDEEHRWAGQDDVARQICSDGLLCMALVVVYGSARGQPN